MAPKDAADRILRRLVHYICGAKVRKKHFINVIVEHILMMFSTLHGIFPCVVRWGRAFLGPQSLELRLHGRGVAEPVVYEAAGDGELLGKVGQVVAVEPGGLLQFLSLQVELAGVVVGVEAHHEAAGVGPGLRVEVAYVADGESCLLAHLSHDGLLEGLAGLYEACYEAEEVALEAAATGEEHLVGAPVYEHDDGGGELWPYLLAAVLAALGDVGVELHRAAADAAETGVVVPVEQLGALAGLEVEGLGEVVVALAETCVHRPLTVDHCSRWDGVDGVGAHGSAVRHGGDVENGGPGLHLRGRLLTEGNGAGAVRTLLQQQAVLAEYEIITGHSMSFLGVYELFCYVILLFAYEVKL